MKTYLITGCAGFIGSNFVHYMLKKYPEILLVNLDKLTYAGNLENLKDVEGDPRHVFVQGDICDKELVESLFAKYDFDYVINFAAESHVDRSIKNPEIFVQSNVMGTVNLLQRAKEAWYDADAKTWKEGKKYLQVSTDEVYGALGADGFFMETTPLCPHSPYSSSKASADMFVMAFHDTYGMPVNITRCSNNYEPWVALGAVAAAIPFVEICAADRTKPLAAFDAQDRGGEFEENIGGSQLCQIKLPVRYYYILIVVLTVQG